MSSCRVEPRQRNSYGCVVRVAPASGGIEIDLGDHQHTRIKIAAGKVDAINSGSEAVFFRTPFGQSLVMPAAEGNVRLLQKYVNLDAISKVLFIGWLTYTLAHPKVASTKYVILVLQGNQGSGKTSLCNNVILRLLDPTSVGVQVLPANQRELAIASQNAHVLCFDNLRDFRQSMADKLCIASTGGAITSRQLYSDADQHVLRSPCCIGLERDPFLHRSARPGATLSATAAGADRRDVWRVRAPID